MTEEDPEVLRTAAECARELAQNGTVPFTHSERVSNWILTSARCSEQVRALASRYGLLSPLVTLTASSDEAVRAAADAAVAALCVNRTLVSGLCVIESESDVMGWVPADNARLVRTLRTGAGALM
jgi:hypothetical protein